MLVQELVTEKTEKVWTTLRLEFGKDARKTAVIVRALYSLKSTGAALKYTLLDAWNLLGTSLVRLTWIYGINKESDQKIGESTTHIYCVKWMTFYVSITMQMLCWNGYISPSHFSSDFTIQTCT